MPFVIIPVDDAHPVEVITDTRAVLGMPDLVAAVTAIASSTA